MTLSGSPRTPRMPSTAADDHQRLWMAVGIAAILGWYTIVGRTVPSLTTLFLLLYGWSLVVVLLRQARAAWRIRRVVHTVRVLNSAGRAEVIGSFADAEVRAAMARLVARHGEPEWRGPVRRFTFSPVDRRDTRILYWLTALLAVGVLGAGFSGRANGSVSLVLAGALVPALWLLQRRLAMLRQVLEISPFGVAEIIAEGRVRRMLFRHPLTLLNRPWRRRLELHPAGSRDFIGLPYSLVALEEAVELITRYGQFTNRGETIAVEV
jgi:hypothetical protein